jgi:hypothetical protein
MFNNPASLQWVISGLVGPTGNCPGGGEFCKIFNPPFKCTQSNCTAANNCVWTANALNGLPDRGECKVYTYLNPGVDTTLKGDGLSESRPKPNLQHTDVGARQFTTLNFQYYIKNGGSASNYRSGPVMIGRGWYDKGFAYANATFKNYMDFFHGSTSISIPTVSGTISLQMGHAEGGGTVTKRLMLDPAFHIGHEGTILYESGGNGDVTYNWNTTTVANGQHILLAMTEEEGSIGIHTGLAKVIFNVQN